jgi:hypothetical protein
VGSMYHYIASDVKEKSPIDVYLFIKSKNQLIIYKKYKEIGVSNCFNISNRISPKFYNYSSYSYSENVSGIIELDILKSGSFSYGFIMSFADARNWGELQATAFINYGIGDFNIEEYFYTEKFHNYFLGSNLTYQLGKYQFYIESIFKGKAEQKVISADTGLTDEQM